MRNPTPEDAGMDPSQASQADAQGLPTELSADPGAEIQQ